MDPIHLDPLSKPGALATSSTVIPLAFINRLTLIIFTLLIAFVVFDYAKVLKQRCELPPGGFPLPIFGNHFALPKNKPWIVFERWAKQYNNPLITVWLGSRPTMVLNDAWVASDLLEKRAALYASRPTMVVMADVSGQTHVNQTTLPYGDRWRNHRKTMHTAVGSQAVREYRPFQADEGKVMTKEVMDDPADYVMSIERYSASVTSTIAWGRRISKKNDYVVQQALGLMESVDAIIPGKYMMVFPSHSSTPNFAQRLLTTQSTTNLSNADIAALTADFIGGGVDTTTSSILTFLLAMLAFPDVQRKAHTELSRICSTRSPTWIDESSLPYISAIVKETLRWRTVTILAGIPDAPVQDDVYRGYRIPAGTTITGNLWAIHRYPREFFSPDEFRPERYLDGLRFEYLNSRGHNAFGWGGRQCSGQPLAEQSLFATVARRLWAAREVDIWAYNDSENMRPLPFGARFVPRSEEIKEVVVREAREARERLRRWDGETNLTVEGAAQGEGG
ncbi:hypothetical protein KVT40_004417 [Elsinoe batatas]|uniref:Cytochrome P450 n=1 Tax=Elsinoe batatas TaxID=2601811 RepID=A0A8K0PK75_9PEZI|nr:hypothetical protein KVT40_004417 [Elsinoe batatas]